MVGYQIDNYEVDIYERFTILGLKLTLRIDGGITSVEVDNRFILMPKVMEVMACSTFLNYPSSKSLPSSGHSCDNSVSEFESLTWMSRELGPSHVKKFGFLT